MTRNTLWQLLLGRKGCDKMAKPTLAEKDILNPSETIKFFNLSNRKFYKFLGETDGGDLRIGRSTLTTSYRGQQTCATS